MDTNNLQDKVCLLSKFSKHIKASYPLWSPTDYDEVRKIIEDEFQRIKQLVCEEHNFDKEQIKATNNGDSLFLNVFHDFERKILYNIETSHTRGNESFQKLIDSLTLLYEMDSPAAMYCEIAAYFTMKRFVEYFDNYNFKCQSDEQWETEEQKKFLSVNANHLMNAIKEYSFLEWFLIKEEIDTLS